MMMKSVEKAAGCAMSAWTWMVSMILLSCRFHGVQLLEGYRNSAEDAAKIPLRDNSSLIHGGWGLPDSVAIVGRIFRYQLPTYDAACGNLTDYRVTVAGDGNGDLPPWLTFNKTESSIEGVPRPDVSGQTHNVQMTATCITTGGGGSPVSIKEYFTIKVLSSDRDRSPEFDSDAPFGFKSSKRNTATSDDVIAPVRCDGTGGSVTTATVTIDADDSLLTSVDRLRLMRRLSAHLGLPETAVRLAAAVHQKRPGGFDGGGDGDDGALVAGPGDAERPTTAGLLVQWDVGCGNVFADHMPVLELLEVTSGNGTMRQAVGHPVVGWHVSSAKTGRRRRPKRRAYFVDNPTATPTPSASRPSPRPVPTSIVSATDFPPPPPTRIVLTTWASVAGPEATKSHFSTASPSRPKDSKSTKPTTAARPTKSPTPTSAYVPVTSSRVASSEETGTAPLGATTVTVGMTKNPTMTSSSSEYVSGIEPSVVTEAGASIRPTDVLPVWTTSAFATDPAVPLATVMPTATLPTAPSKSPSPKTSKRPPRPTKPSTSRTTTVQINRAPVVLKPLEVIKVFVGRQVSIKIPNDTFGDDGGAEDLFLMLLQDGRTIPPPNWINFNDSSNTLYGLALEEDIGTHAYEMSALNRHSRVVKTPCIFEVEADPSLRRANNEFSVTVDMEYEKVQYDLVTRLNLINRIAAAFGDSDSGKMQILRISRGSVVIAYSNNTLPSEPCPQKEIEALLRLVLQPDGRISETFAKAMEPYRVLKAEGGLARPCSAADSTVSTVSSQALTPHQPSTITTTTVALEVDVKPRVQQTDNRLLLYILLPLLLFVVLLLLVVVICVVCYRRQRRRRKEEDKLTGLHKGIPIIFADELLDEKPETTPVSTLKSRSAADDGGGGGGGRQSVPPPEYPASKAGSRSSTLRSDYKTPLISDDEDEDGESASHETLPRKTATAAAAARGDNVSTTTPLLHFRD